MFRCSEILHVQRVGFRGKRPPREMSVSGWNVRAKAEELEGNSPKCHESCLTKVSTSYSFLPFDSNRSVLGPFYARVGFIATHVRKGHPAIGYLGESSLI